MELETIGAAGKMHEQNQRGYEPHIKRMQKSIVEDEIGPTGPASDTEPTG
jgi:hypothetical protein